VNGSNRVFLKALDDFLEDDKDHKLAEGIQLPRKGLRRITAIDGLPESEGGAPDYHQEFSSQLEKQASFRATLADPEEKHVEIEDCQEYLRQTEEREEWDCESILSTYSTLDNHPSIIKVLVRILSIWCE
jgi:hypothetical protein